MIPIWDTILLTNFGTKLHIMCALGHQKLYRAWKPFTFTETTPRNRKKKIRFISSKDATTWGSSIKDVHTNLEIFWTPPLPVQACPHLVDHPSSPCPCGHKAGIFWNIATSEQFTLKGKKNWSFWYWMYTHVCSY